MLQINYYLFVLKSNILYCKQFSFLFVKIILQTTFHIFVKIILQTTYYLYLRLINAVGIPFHILCQWFWFS